MKKDVNLYLRELVLAKYLRISLEEVQNLEPIDQENALKVIIGDLEGEERFVRAAKKFGWNDDEPRIFQFNDIMKRVPVEYRAKVIQEFLNMAGLDHGKQICS